jgi:hypothetical protein
MIYFIFILFYFLLLIFNYGGGTKSEAPTVY